MENIFDIKVFLLFYLLQMTDLSTNTLGKQLREYIQENRISHHVINFIFIFVLLSLELKKQDAPVNQLALNSITIYLLYILSTKVDLQFNVIILALCIIYYLYQRNVQIKYNRLLNDSELDDEERKNIMLPDNHTDNLINIFVLLFILYCVYLYSGRKKTQYNNNFSYINFLLY
jgi:hypothetical protein